MDDELSAARRRGRLRKLFWPHGQKRRVAGFLHRRRWVWAALVVLVCALTAVAIAIFGGRQPQPQGHPGVAALYDFFRGYAQNKEIQSQGPFGGLGQRLMREPFEISLQATVASEDLKRLGIPLESIPAQASIKYDLQDLGLQAGTLGMDLFGAYIIEDSIVVDPADGEPEVVADIPAEGDVDADMTLEERLHALLPFLPDDTSIGERLFDALSGSVPLTNTSESQTTAYSPLSGGYVGVTEVKTVLDAKALSETAAAFSLKMKEDGTLRDDTQALLDDITAYFGLEAVDIDTLLTKLENQDYSGIELCWSVCSRDGKPMGLLLSLDTGGTKSVLTTMVEFEGKTSYERTTMTVNDTDVFSVDYSLEFEGDTGVISAAITLAGGSVVSVGGTFEYVQYTGDAYGISADIEVLDIPYNNEKLSGRCSLDARIDVGDDLGTLEESRNWRRIFDKEWKDVR